MKKKVWYVILAMMVGIFTFVSCSSSDEVCNVSASAEYVSPLQLELDELNRNILSQLGIKETRSSHCNCSRVCTKSCSCPCKGGNQQQQEDKDTIGVILNDAAGALAGAAAGIEVGGYIGTVSLPLIGTISASTVVGLLGALVGGIASSWNAWNYQTVDSISQAVYDSTSVIRYDNVIGLLNKTVFIDTVRTKMQLVKSIPHSTDFIVSEQLYKLASLHNSTLEVVDDSCQHGPLYRYLNTEIIPISAIDSIGVIYNNIMVNNTMDYLFYKPAQNSTDHLHVVFYNFADLFSSIRNRFDAERVIDAYTKATLRSPNLYSSERADIILALYVCWHSYNYWTNLQ